MGDPETRRRRRSGNLTEIPKSGPKCHCPRCGYGYGKMGDVEETSAELAMVSGVLFDCPECGARGVPTAEPPKRIEPPAIPGDVRTIVENVFTIDYAGEWRRLHEQLEVGLGRTDLNTVTMHLDKAEDNARAAHKLAVNLRLDYDRYKVDREVIWAAMRAEATAALQGEKDGGKRNKSITDGDVEAKMAELHPDEYKIVALEEKRYGLAVKHAETFAELWASKCRSLQSILGRMRGGGER